LLYCFDLVQVNASNSTSPALTLAVCILFGGFMGLLDDWMDLRWRYKAFFPIFVALPLAAFRERDRSMTTYIFGKVNFGIYFYIFIIPIILAIVTNAENQLGAREYVHPLCFSVFFWDPLLTLKFCSTFPSSPMLFWHTSISTGKFLLETQALSLLESP